MTLSPLQLAAIVSAGVPGIYPVATAAAPEESAEYDTAIITDSADRNWRVRAPRNHDASMRLEAEHQVLRSFTHGLRARLPFTVPTIAGTGPYNGMSVFVYTYVPGTHRDLDELARINRANNSTLATDLGRLIATLHVMPEDIMIESDLPVYSSQNLRRRKLSELDRAASTRKVPAELVAHWRAFLEPGPIWDFRTRVVHGKLGTETISIHNGTVAEVSGWSEVHVGDPAQDLSWLFACSDTAFTDEVVRVYSSQMPQIPDQHLVERAEFYAEFALAQWLTHAVEYGDAQMIAHGEQMLQAVCENLRDSGDMLGQNQPLPERAEGLE